MGDARVLIVIWHSGAKPAGHTFLIAYSECVLIEGCVMGDARVLHSDLTQWCRTWGAYLFNYIFCWGQVLLTHWCSAEQSYREVVSGRWKLPSTQNIFIFFSQPIFVNFDKTKNYVDIISYYFFLARPVLGGISTMILAATITKMFRYLWYW